jgi:hypothetical protein
LYHDEKKTFPVGNFAPPAEYPNPSSNPYAGGWWGFQARILPFMESKNVYGFCNFTYSGSCFDWITLQETKGIKLGTMILAYHKCPDDPLSNRNATWYGQGVGYYGCTNYLGVMGTTPYPVVAHEYDGILFHANSSGVVKMAQITDGSAHTLIMGERGISDDLYGWPYCGAGLSNTGDGDNLMATDIGLSRGSATGNDNWHFWSYHKNIAQFLWADGACRPLSYNIDFHVFQSLSTRAGHEVIPSDYDH